MKATINLNIEGYKFSHGNLVTPSNLRSIADQARTIRIPVHMVSIPFVRTGRQMLHEIIREPTPEELSSQMPLEKVRKVMKIAKEPISLETPIGDEEDSQSDFIEDKNAVYP